MQESKFLPNLKHVESKIGNVVFQHEADITYIAKKIISIIVLTTSTLAIVSDDED